MRVISRTRRGKLAGAAILSLAAGLASPAAGEAAQEVDQIVLGNTRPYTEMDYDAYERDLNMTVETLNQFWSGEFQRVFERTYWPPARLRPYDPETGDAGLACGPLEPPGPRNANYCLVDDVVQWDERGLIVPFYHEIGDFAAMFTLAHEWAHAVQARLGILGRYTTMATELQADCFAGAWAGFVEQQPILADGSRVYLEKGDVDEATLGLFTARDPVGTPWLDPGAHGTGNQRIRAFNDGLDGGVEACITKELPQQRREE